MIAASEPQEFVPYGRQQMTRHPGAVVVPSTQPQLQPESFLIDRFSQVNIDSHTENEWWTLRSVPTTDKDVLIDNEEELYVAGKTAVLSHGITGHSIGNCGTELPAGRMLSRSYTTESNITQALWCNFVKPINQTEVISMPSVCLLDSTKVNIYTLEGEDFLSPLQFKIASAWNTKFGLLLERVSSPASSSPNFIPATLFSLLHPLDEMAPLFLLKQGGILSYMNDPCMKVVFTAEEPSLCVMFDVRTGLHSVWKLRKATNEECQLMCVENSLYSTQNQSSALFSNFSQSSSVSKRGSFANRSSLPNTGSSANFSSPFSCNSPMFSFSNSRTQSPLVTGVRSHSPGVKNTPTPPMSWSSRKAQFTMALGSPSTPPLDARLGTSHVVSETVYEPRPIMPELCLEYIWTENQGVSSFKNGETIQASRIFQISDVLGQSYLCYLLKPRNQLMCARLGKTNEKIPEVLIGAVSHIPAKDAAPLPSLKMIAVLEPSGGVCLYTGTTPVGKVHVAGINTALASSLYLSSVTAGLIANSPFPKRSSLLSSTKTGDALFDERVHLLSPVPSISYVSEQSDHDLIVTSTPRDGHLHALRDPVANRLTLEFLNGSMFRIAFPEVCSSPLVQECVRVLKTVLPKEVAILLVVKWYAARNAPGSQDISPHLEWELFNIVLLGLLGYDVDKLPLQLRVNMDVPETHMQVKKKKSADNGTDEDWTYLINSKYSDTNAQNISRLLGINRTLFRDDNIHAESTDSTKEIKGHINCSSPLFQYFHLILFSLHLLYEELKLNLLLVETLPMMSVLLQHLSRDMKLDEYVIHYWKDFPQTCILDNVPSQIEKEDLEKLSTPIYITTTPPSIFHQLYGLLQRHPGLPTYPYISQVNPRSKDMLQLVGMLCSGVDQLETLVQCVVPTGSRSDLNNLDKTILKDFIKHSKYTRTQRCVLLMNEMGYTRRDLTTLPAGLALILGDAIHRVREAPPADWPEPAYRLIDRQDLAATPPPPAVGERGSATPPPPAVTRNNQETDDGMESMDREILKLRFNKDQRVSDVRRLLQSSQPVTIAIQQRPEVSDHEFIEEQEKHLYAICTRTMALPVGRGMLTLHTACPVSSEPLSVPRLCTTGKAPPRGTTVELTHIEIVPNMSLWPMFHNGVAAGLRIAPSASNIDSTWIVYNKPKAGQTPDYLPEHAGFLMALGLNGHLKNLAQLNTFDYLTRCHEMTSVGLLLGIAATKRGTMDVETTKILSIHIESLLPPTSIELDIVQNIQVAALLSVGLVYQGTAHRHIAEVLLSEMGRPPGPEMENSVDRESYALAAGLGLGLVVLGRGSDVSGLNDLGIADTLHYYMIGGHKRPLTGSQKEKYKSPSYQIREGDCVNNDVTSPGATLALGMMYFKTGNMAVANWMKAPDTQYLLDFVCPDFLLLRMVARGLILWDDIIPSIGWVEQHVPTAIRPYCLVKPHPGSLPDSVDVETMNQAYCNILAGACMAMGLRFAGSCNQKAFKTLHHYCKMFTSLSGKSIAELAGKSTIETCLNVILLSLAMVMAGSGDLSVLRICRYLNSRVGQPNNSVVTYGSHLATHMALGLLFLGGGRYTLSTSPESIAAMLCAFFPKFPTHSNDNRYHLQAFRHLYVLAAESRLLLPRDIDTGSLCYAHVTVVYLDTEHYQNQSAKLKAPCLLPELKYLKEVRVEDDRYWTVVFRRDQNWSQLQNLLSGSVGVKQHVGCLSYIEDPHGFRSLLAQTLSTDKSVPWSVPAESIFAFSSDPSTVNFAHYFLEHGDTSTTSEHSELQLMQFLTKLVYECVTHDKLSIIPIWINIIKAIQSLEHAPSGILTWQLKLLIAQAISPCDTGPTPLVSPELALSVENQISTILDTWESTILSEVLPRYLQNLELQAGVDTLSKLAMYLNFYDFPPVYAIVNAVQGNWNILTMYMALQKYNLPYSTLRRIVSVLRKT